MELSDFHWSDIITKVVAAVIILIITWFLAKFAKKILTKLFAKVKVLNRPDGTGDSLGTSLSSIISLVIWVFGLMAVLNLFRLDQVTAPLQDMLSTLLHALPQILGAAMVMFIGFVLAKIVRELVVTALQAANVDRFADKFTSQAGSQIDSATGTGAARHDAPQHLQGDQQGLGQAHAQAQAQHGQTGSEPVKISSMVGMLVFAVVLLVVAISALQILGIKSISDPASHMLKLILDTIPLIIGAGILLAIGCLIAKFAGTLLENLLRGMNTQGALSSAGIESENVDVPKVVSRIVQIAIVLFFAVAAANVLHIPQMTEILNTVLSIGGRVVFGAVIIMAGVYVAGLLSKMVSGRTGDVVKIATIVLFAAIGLRYMGLANSVINLAFGAVVIGGAAAAALAFGLGGRDAAARQLEKMQNDSAASKAPTTGTEQY
ncbi:MAG TPA: mechanosensitive ion channel [Flexivirga sp.]|uniref:mechanosensitive ion channel n=1 Tax=Flexivirga sp. TaxID=1962927 RepID=UPI002B94F410|nr:mechanosensitive ion channel [Flexivirga sp.]HWC21030.1 mechanosensitive ion channel [Flexivirga sp.]